MEIAIDPRNAHLLRRLGNAGGGHTAFSGGSWCSAGGVYAGAPQGIFSAAPEPGTGDQTEEVQPWNPADFCTEESARITVSVEDRVVTVRAWRYDMKGRYGHVVPIYLLDTDLEGNSGWDRGLTDHLYGGDTNYRLQQEIVLGMGGVRMANALGLNVNVYHMNEGHAALLTLALLESEMGGGPLGCTQPSPTLCRCATSACSQRIRRCRRVTIVFRRNSQSAFWAATGRRGWRSWACSKVAC